MVLSRIVQSATMDNLFITRLKKNISALDRQRKVDAKEHLVRRRYIERNGISYVYEV